MANLKPIPQHLLMDRQPWPRQNPGPKLKPRTFWIYAGVDHSTMTALTWATNVPATKTQVAWQDTCGSDVPDACPSPCLHLPVKPTESQSNSWHSCGSCEHCRKTALLQWPSHKAVYRPLAGRATAWLQWLSQSESSCNSEFPTSPSNQLTDFTVQGLLEKLIVALLEPDVPLTSLIYRYLPVIVILCLMNPVPPSFLQGP